MLPPRAARQGFLEHTLDGVLAMGPSLRVPGGGEPSAEGDNTVRFSQQEDPAYFLQFCILLFIKLTNSYIF